MPPFAPFPLTPSELVYLHGDQYASRKSFNNVKLLHIDLGVSASELAYAMLSTALLACEAEGVLRFMVSQQKGLLKSHDALSAVVGPAGAIWPSPSIESRLLKNRLQLDPNAPYFVSSMVYDLLSADSAAPGADIVNLCKPYMAQRGLIVQNEKKTLKVFTSYTYELPQATLQGARQFPMERINQMLSSTQQTRPDFWKMLIANIKTGVSMRVEQRDDDDF